jgi:hypothetical protein
MGSVCCRVQFSFSLLLFYDGFTDSLGWKHISYHAAQASGSHVLCLYVFVRSRSSQTLAALFLQFSALLYCWWDCRHTQVEIGQCRQRAVRSSVSCVLWWVQIFQDACRFLSALHFCLTNPGRKEIREN